MKSLQSILTERKSNVVNPLYKAKNIVSSLTSKEKPIQLRHKV